MRVLNGYIINKIKGVCMKKRQAISLLLASLIFTSVPQANIITDTSITAEAHGGRTDSNGGHKDNKNKSGLGSYHYHCGGYPAHLHTNGVCPYQTTQAPQAMPAQTEPAPIGTDTPAALNPGWHKDTTGWQYVHDDLTISKAKWEYIGGAYYCFDENGYLYVSTYTPDGYWVNENGEWVD